LEEICAVRCQPFGARLGIGTLQGCGAEVLDKIEIVHDGSGFAAKERKERKGSGRRL